MPEAVIIRVARARLHPEPLPLPSYQSEGAAGMDLLADLEGPLTLAPLQRAAVPTGLMLELPQGFEGQVRPRSGLALRAGLTCLNSPGTIDSDYRGEVKVILINLSDAEVTLERGERIAQLVVAPVARARWDEAQELTFTARGDGGFGSTGKRG